MSRPASTTRAFSLVELLVVIAIIAIVIAIIVPALGHARTAARVAVSRGLLNDVSNAAMTFGQDNGGRMPGYFSPADMGSASNVDKSRGGFTAMENVMLELNGLDAITGEAGLQGGGNGTQGVLVGPHGNAGNAGKSGAKNVKVDIDLIGSGKRVYFTPDAKYYSPVDSQEASKNHKALPDLIDAFGNPVLAWIEDPAMSTEPSSPDEFALIQTKPGDPRARFYWASNFAFLSSPALAKGGKNQQTDSFLSSTSIPSNSASDPVLLSMVGVLGNPGFPTPAAFDASNVLPGAARGAFILHSAGPDGVYFGRKDKGAKLIDSDEIPYSAHFFDPAGNRYLDDAGKAAPIDLNAEFDDIMSSSGT